MVFEEAGTSSRNGVPVKKMVVFSDHVSIMMGKFVSVIKGKR